MDTFDKVAFLERIPLLKLLSREELERLARLTRKGSARRSRFLYLPGDPVQHLYFILSGRVKIGSYIADRQREIVKDLLFAGGVLGERAILGERVHSEFAQVLSHRVEYLSVDYPDFMPLMRNNTKVMWGCLQYLSNRLCRMEDRLTQLMVRDARQRVVEFLLEMAAKEGTRIGYETLIRDFFPQQEIANITGTSRQTVTAVLNELRKSNVIHFNRHSMLIRDVSKLV